MITFFFNIFTLYIYYSYVYTQRRRFVRFEDSTLQEGNNSWKFSSIHMVRIPRLILKNLYVIIVESSFSIARCILPCHSHVRISVRPIHLPYTKYGIVVEFSLGKLIFVYFVYTRGIYESCFLELFVIIMMIVIT